MILTGLMTILQPAQQTRPQGGLGFMGALIPFVLVFVIFYVLIIMPQRKRQKKHMMMVDQLKPGDRIVTSGGIHGTIMGVHPDRLELKVAANVKIEITKSAVAVILGAQKSEQKTE
jgi:preprotein translocase subunit YajC